MKIFKSVEIIWKNLHSCCQTQEITVMGANYRDAGVVYSEIQGSKYATSSR